MIEIGGQTFDLSDPVVLAVLAGAGLVLLVLVLLVLALLAARRSARMAEPMIYQLDQLGRAVDGLSQGQAQLTGGLSLVSETQATAQTKVMQTLEARLAEVQQQMTDRLSDNALKSARSLSDMQEKMNAVLQGGSEKTTKSLTELEARLKAIDAAQENITKLSGDVLSLQDILSNKQTRGAFGEIQLTDIVSKALPSDSYKLQATLSNGKRADCLIELPNPPGPIVIDAKFPLEAYEAMRAAEGERALAEAARAFRTAVRAHIKAISEKYIIDGETADGALMFLPSEAVYAELHAGFSDIVREGFAARVWIVSPTTCMATLNTMRAVLKDARMREQAGAIRKELSALHGDVGRLVDRVGNLDRHFSQASKDIEEIKISAEKAGKRSLRLDRFEFDDAPEVTDEAEAAKVLHLTEPRNQG
ncbi:MAG: DNA recombination protein RmuC [Pseudomonadota bacterium]